ncbi:hypothetical protein GCM10011309_20320 [Litorimonas cladophorae]|uniref:Uncharacterized protein n=1 Tax=Litorimonas cladophorae TaxID=1220491 RepID=A0A918KNV1_9PROT|nr:hypothetical protein [Litorimonas cladophorae]GGX70183.1 hypothetical protein GCM10011309_20320 [Litorimonas cladophorae]
MDKNRFFNFIWRTNGVLLFGIAVVTAGFLTYFAMFALAEMRNDDLLPPPADASNTIPPTNEKLRVVIPRTNRDTDGFTYFELRAGEDTFGKLSSYRSSQIRNFAVYDLSTDSTKWLFPESQQEIETIYAIEVPLKVETEKTKLVTQGFLLQVATSRADKSIVRDLWVVFPNGEGLRKILPNISGDFSIKLYQDIAVKLVVERENEIDVYPLNIEHLTIGEPTTIPLPRP